MNKIIISIILFFAVCLTTSGQRIDQSTNRYRGDDVLEKRRVEVKDFSLEGNRGVWSLEDAEISKGKYNAEYTTETDTLRVIERGNRTYYRQDRGVVCIIGTENYMELVSYDMPETWLTFPMQQGDSVSGYFNGTGKYCETFFVRRFGTYKTKADEVGRLVLPGGDTLRNVIRLHTERYVGTVTAPIDTMKCKIPAFTVDSIVQHLIPDSAIIREDVYRWYADGYRYPVLEATTVSYCKEKLSEELFYCPPDMQEQLALDDENKAARAAYNYAAFGYPSGGQHNETGDKGSFTYRFSLNEGSQTVTVSYTTDADAKVSVLLANNQGFVFRRASQSDGSDVTLSYSGLRPGQYILHISCNGQEHAEKFNVK